MSEVAEKQEVRVLPPGRWKAIEYANAIYCVTAEVGTPLTDLLKPDYWAHMAVLLRPYDKIFARVDDEAWYAELLVVSCSRNHAVMKLLLKTDLHDAPKQGDTEETFADYRAEWGGPAHKFRVVRVKDGAVLKHGMVTKGEAVRAAAEYAKGAK